MAQATSHKSSGFPFHLTAIVTLCLIVSAHPVSSQRLSKLWWNDLKSTNGSATAPTDTNTNTLLPPPIGAQAAVSAAPKASSSASLEEDEPPTPEDTSGLTDDELVSEASRLNSKMVRLGRKASNTDDISNKFIRRATQFDDSVEQDVFDQPASTAAASNQFMKRSGFGFPGGPNRQDGGRDRIWSYFDNKMNSGSRQSSWKNEPSRFSSFDSRLRGSPKSDLADDFISRQFNKRQNGAGRPSSSAFPSTSKKAATDDRVVNFNFNRKKNPEDKERWRQLIQSIFDSSPRPSQYPGARVSSKSKFSDLPFTYGSGKPKTRTETANALGAGKTKAEADDDEDVLKDEREENVDLKDKISEEEEEEDEEGASSPQLPPDDESKEDGALDTGNAKRQAPAEIAQEDDDEEPEDDAEEEEENQYLRSGKNQTGVANIGNGSAKRSTSSNTGSSFGARINRSNSTSPLQSPGRRVQTEKPKFTMHFQLGKSATTTEPGVTDQLISALENDPAFSGNGQSTTSYGAATTTASPFDSPSTERFDALNTSTEEDDLFERSKPVNRETTAAVTTTTESPKRSATGKGKPGKWLDNETFRVNDDRSMIMLPEDEEEDDPDNFSDEEEPSLNEVPSGPTNRNVLAARRNRMAHGPVAPPPQTLTKRRLTSPQSRTVRQDDLAGTDDISRLAAALPGTPGQDYPIFGFIPRTGFNCHDHQWPGYYADVETQCQVFHICQTGGRKNSFLCPNGTLFNQQLFVCDWWHNVQCDQVMSHYELNANIYDYNWESKRMKSTARNPKRSIDVSSGGLEILKRVGDLKSASNDSNDSVATTTASSLSEDVTTTEPTNTLFTETVFGSRSSKADADEAEQKKKRAVSGVKGGKLVKFNRINSLASSTGKGNSKSGSIVSGTTSSFFNRYKYASHQQMTEAGKPAKATSAKLIQSAPSSSLLSSPFRSRPSSSSSSGSVSSSSHLPFTSHLSSSSLRRTKHYRA